MFLNNSRIGAVNLTEGGEQCYNVTLNSGNNLLELRLTKEMGAGTRLEIVLNDGEARAEFTGSTNHRWNIAAP